MTNSKLCSYLITDPLYYPDLPSKFGATLTKALIQYKPNYACFRDKRSNTDISENILQFIKLCRQFNVLAFINSDIKTASLLKFDGVHLPSSMLKDISSVKKLNLQSICSCHNENEIDFCIKNGADFITLSPLFASPNKGEPIGVDSFNKMLENKNIRTFALGGIVDEEEIEKLKYSKAYGFASIRYFIKD